MLLEHKNIVTTATCTRRLTPHTYQAYYILPTSRPNEGSTDSAKSTHNMLYNILSSIHAAPVCAVQDARYEEYYGRFHPACELGASTLFLLSTFWGINARKPGNHAVCSWFSGVPTVLVFAHPLLLWKPCERTRQARNVYELVQAYRPKFYLVQDYRSKFYLVQVYRPKFYLVKAYRPKFYLVQDYRPKFETSTSWFKLIALNFIWFTLIALNFIWFKLIALIFIWFKLIAL